MLRRLRTLKNKTTSEIQTGLRKVILFPRLRRYIYKMYTVPRRRYAHVAWNSFKQLKASDPKTFGPLSPVIRKAILITSRVYAQEEIFNDITKTFVALLVTISWLVIAFITAAAVPNTFTPIRWLTATIVWILILTILIRLETRMLELNPTDRDIWHIVLFIVGGCIAIYIRFSLDFNQLSFLTMIIFVVAVSFPLSLISSNIIIRIWLLLYFFVSDRLRGYNFHSIIIYRMIITIDSLKNTDADWYSLQYKRQQAKELGGIALLIRKNLPFALMPTASSRQNAFSDLAARIAATFVRYQIQLLTSTAKTRDEIASKLDDSLVHVTLNEWEQLEQSDTMTDNQTNIIGRILQAIVTIVIGAIPLIVVRIAQISNILPAGTASEILTLLTILWLAITILDTIDPRYRERIGTLKSLRDLLP